jgi:hypothetical protein
MEELLDLGQGGMVVGELVEVDFTELESLLSSLEQGGETSEVELDLTSGSEAGQ